MNKREYYLGILLIFIKQSVIWLDYVLETFNLGLKGNVKYKFNLAKNALNSLNSFFESILDKNSMDDHYEVSAIISDFIEALSLCNPEERGEIINYIAKLKENKLNELKGSESQVLPDNKRE